MNTVLEDFLIATKPLVSAQGYSTLAKNARRFEAWLASEDLFVTTVGIHEAVRYQAYLGDYHTAAGTPYSAGSIHNYLKAAKRWCAWLVQTEQRSSNPFADIRYPRLSQHLSKNILSEAQMGRLLTELSHFDTLANQAQRLRRYRVHVLAELLYATGLRIAEAASICLSAIDLGARRIYLAQGKHGKPRTVFFGSYVQGILAHYLRQGRSMVLGDYPRHNDHTLFATHHQRLASVVNAELALVCRYLELPIMTTHCFRHSLGTHLLRAGCDIRYIQVMLGHDSLASTQIYTRVDKDDLKRSVDTFHPRQWARTGAV